MIDNGAPGLWRDLVSFPPFAGHQIDADTWSNGVRSTLAPACHPAPDNLAGADVETTAPALFSISRDHAASDVRKGRPDHGA